MRARFGLRVKFFLYSNTLIVVTMAIVTALAIAHERHARYEAIERRGRSICEVMAIPITDALMFDELGVRLQRGLIDNLISEIQAFNRDLVRYVIVTDPGGRVTHSSDWRQVGQRSSRALERSATGQASVAAIRDGAGAERILEVRTSLSISTKFWGSLSIGFSLQQVEDHVQRIAKRAVQVAIVLLIGNSALTAVYVETLIRPILGLHRTMKRAAGGDLSARAQTRGGAEVGELAAQFNRLMDDLEEADERDKVRQTQLAHTEKMAAVGTLAAGVAHEVNNPLGGIFTCIENMRAEPGDSELQSRYLGLIQDGLERIEQTVANLLDFSRQRRIELTPTSINHALEHVGTLIQYQLRKGGIKVRWDLDPDLPYVMADHFQMEQLYLNLALNALQAMPEGGELTLRTRRQRETVVVEVRDTGVGIPENLRERVFDPFFTTRDVGEGTGLGLTVSDSIVSAHRGTMVVESVVGQGSVFRIVLPLLRQGAAGDDVE